MKRFASVWTLVSLMIFLAGTATAQSPVPVINQPLSPDAMAPGAPGFMLTVNGSGFVSGAVVKWNKTALVTNFVNHDRLTAHVPAAKLNKPGTAYVSVSNPVPGGTSNSVAFTITRPTMALGWKPLTQAAGTSPINGVVADFNNDGKPDMAVVSSAANGVVSIMLGNGNGKFTTKSQLSTSHSNPEYAAVADFNQDGNMDLAVLSSPNCMGCAEITIFLGNGDGTFTQVYESPGLDGNYFSLAIGDFNGDGKLDLAASYISEIPNVALYLGNGDGTFNYEGVLDFTVPVDSNWLVTGDFNGDGFLDVALASQDGGGEFQTGPVTIYLGKGDGTFSAAPTQPITTLSSPMAIITADLDGDGILDLAFADNAGGPLVVLHGNGDGTFTQVNGEPTSIPSNFIGTADINGDNKPDLVLSSTSPASMSVYLGNGDGTFQNASTISVPSLSQGFGVADFNGDGRFDLAAADSSTNNVSILVQAPIATASQSSIWFGNQPIGITTSPSIVWVKNTGSADLDIFSIAIVGANTGDFTQSNNCSSVLIPGKSCQFEVTFTPQAPGQRAAGIKIVDNAGAGSQSIGLHGVGVANPRGYSSRGIESDNSSLKSSAIHDLK